MKPLSNFRKYSNYWNLRSIFSKPQDQFQECDVKPGISKCRHHGESFKIAYKRLIDGNASYVAEKKVINPDYFKSLAVTQKPNYFMIGCSDSRVPPNEMTKTEPGEIFIHRNIANQVLLSDMNCMSVLQYAVEYLEIDHVIVMGHTGCGGIKAAYENKSLGFIDHWLSNIREIAFLNSELLKKIETEEEFLKILTELNVKHQVFNVCKSPIVQKAWNLGRQVRVSGWMCDISTGLIKDLDVGQAEWNAIENFYELNFNHHHHHQQHQEKEEKN